MPAVEIRGNADLRKALRTFTPDLEKALKKEIGAALKPVVAKAKSFVPNEAPMSRWAPRSFSEATFPFWNPTTVKNGITYSTKVGKRNSNGFTSMAQIINKTPVGAIYEAAGRLNPQGQDWVGPKASGTGKGVSRSNNPKAGERFIANLPELVSSHKGRGRLIYRAWRDSKGVAEGAVMKAIDKAESEFYRRAAAGPLRKPKAA
jgi:hypothetical protein